MHGIFGDMMSSDPQNANNDEGSARGEIPNANRDPSSANPEPSSANLPGGAARDAAMQQAHFEEQPGAALSDVPIDIADDEDVAPPPLPPPYYRPAILLQNPPGSRELLLGWCFWLLGSWVLLGMGAHATPVRWMIFAALGGMLLVWPAFRLSQNGCVRRRIRLSAPPPPQAPGAGMTAMTTMAPMMPADADVPAGAPITPEPPLVSRLTPGVIFRDWFALNMVFQAVVWPHLITGLWSLDQAAWVSAAVAAWTLLAGAVIAWGCRSCRGGIRLAAMTLVLLLFIGEPVILAYVNHLGDRTQQPGYDWPMHVSPIEAVYALTAPPVRFNPSPWATPLICVTLAAGAIWVWLGMGPPRRRTT